MRFAAGNGLDRFGALNRAGKGAMIMEQGAAGVRAGVGYDAHRLVTGRKLILGGVGIPFEKGLLGHSDADALAHAIIDAILGACALGDIGSRFPDTDPAYKDISGMELLRRTNELVRRAGYIIGNIDCVCVAQSPKIAPFTGDMRKNIAGALGIGEGQVGVKGKTEEGMGFTGAGEGIAAHAVCIVYKTR